VVAIVGRIGRPVLDQCLRERLGDLGRRLDGRAEVEEAAAERDRTEREPGPAERKAGDDVGEPVDAEHDAAAGDTDGDRRCAGSEQGARTRRASPCEHERYAGVERSGGRRVPARKGRPEMLRNRVEGGADTVEEVLDRVDEHHFADDDRHEERHDPPVARAQHLVCADHDDHRDHHRRARHVRHELQPLRRPVRGVVCAPLAHAPVE